MRCAIVMPLSTARPSTWWNTGVWVASSASVRNVRPGHTTYTGSGRSSSARTCTGRGVGAQHRVGLLARTQVERVLHGAGRVVLAEVQRVEVQPRRLDLGALRDLPAHRHEHVGDLLADLRDGMAGAARDPVPRQRDVDGLLDEHPLVALGDEHLAAGVERGLRLLAGGVDALAGVGALGAGQRAQLAAGQLQRRTIAEVGGSDRGQRGQIGGSVEGRAGRRDRPGQRVGVQKTGDGRSDGGGPGWVEEVSLMMATILERPVRRAPRGQRRSRSRAAAHPKCRHNDASNCCSAASR